MLLVGNEQAAVLHERHVRQVQRALVLDGERQQSRLVRLPDRGAHPEPLLCVRTEPAQLHQQRFDQQLRGRRAFEEPLGPRVPGPPARNSVCLCSLRRPALCNTAPPRTVSVSQSARARWRMALAQPASPASRAQPGRPVPHHVRRRVPASLARPASSVLEQVGHLALQRPRNAARARAHAAAHRRRARASRLGWGPVRARAQPRSVPRAAAGRCSRRWQRLRSVASSRDGRAVTSTSSVRAARLLERLQQGVLRR